MNYETYQIMLYVLSFLAVIVFIALYFVKAGYGMFRTRLWGWSVPNKAGWVLMEAPSFVVMGLWAWKAGVEAYTPQVIFVGLFMLHYFQRSFVFPLLMKGKSRMPLAIMAMGILFNVINATLLAASFFSCALPGKYEPATFWTNPLPWVGGVIFHRYGHQSACGPCNTEFTEAGRYASLPAGERFLSLCDFSQLLGGTGGMDWICLADGFTCGLGVCVVDSSQLGAACRCHLQTLL